MVDKIMASWSFLPCGYPSWIIKKFTFVYNTQCIWWYWVTIFAREKWESMKGIRTYFFLHFQQLSKNATDGPNINWLVVPLFQQNDFRGSVPSCCDSQCELSHGVWNWCSSIDFWGLWNPRLILLFGFNFFGIWSHKSFLLFLFYWLLFRWLFGRLLLHPSCLRNELILFPIIITWFLIFFWSFKLFNNSGKPKITNLDSKAMTINQYVGGFQISVNDVCGM